MLHTDWFGAECKRIGFEFYTGVPCSFLNPLINYAINECEYVAAVNEGEAISIAAGAAIGGKKTVVLMQNSGLTNASSPITSLLYPFQIPILGFVSLRGEPGLVDEPQHELMGRITGEWLSLMNLNWDYLSNDSEKSVMQLQRALACIENNKPFFFIVKKGTFEKIPLTKQESKQTSNHLTIRKNLDDQLPARSEALDVIHSEMDQNTVFIATTGKTGRELFQLRDCDRNLYMVGSMGCVSSFGLGLSLSKKNKNVVVIDGDGAIMMRMGSLATNGYQSPDNFLHILLDNGVHDSTGGQFTVSHNVNFVEIAGACGYSKAIYVHNLEELGQRLKEWKSDKQLTFIHLKIAKGSLANLGRPTLKPYEVKQRLQVFLND